MVQLPPDAPSPRLCVLQKASHDQEYGYNLHAEKGRGQFVGVVDKGSVADVGGLRTGDRIFAINGHSIQGDSHKKVVERIKEQPLRCEMLVATEQEAKWYAEHNIQITLQLPNIVNGAEESRSRHGSKSNGSPQPPSGWYAPNTTKTDPVFVAPPPPHDEMDPLPLLCVLEKSSPSDEFGFNLHAEKGRGHFIGTVDQGGIGDRAGLSLGQRIVGVNGSLVYPNTPHKDVVALIKKSPLSTTLLVASEETDQWHKTHQKPFSFENARHANQPQQQLSPHSIQISDEEIEAPSPAPRQQEEAPKVEAAPPLPVEVLHYEEPPMAQYDLVPDSDLLDAVFSGLPPAEATTTTVVGVGALPEPVEQELLVEHEGHQEPALTSHEETAEAYNPYAPVSSPPSEVYRHEVSHHHEAHYEVHHHHEDHHEVPHANGYSSHTSETSDSFDIFGLSAKEARERLRQQKKRATDMSLEEKYRLVTNM